MCHPMPVLNCSFACLQLEKTGRVEKGMCGEHIRSVVDQELLMQIMEAREAIEAAEDERELQEMHRENQEAALNLVKVGKRGGRTHKQGPTVECVWAFGRALMCVRLETGFACLDG
jgi:HSCB C-terminal oligomerisation domain